MSLVIRVKDATNTTIELGSVRLGTAGFATAAEQGTMAQGTIDIPDKGGVLRLAGLKEIWAEETDSPADNRIFWIGYLADRHIHRGDGELLTGSDRVITANVYDFNELLNDIIIKGAADATHGVRPAETDLARVAWLLQATPSWFPTSGVAGTPPVPAASVHDQGFVATTGGVAMDACDYRGQTPQAVLADCADKSGRNWFIYFDEAAGLFGLWYDKPESDNWPCTLSFSNVPGDADNDLIWWMNPASPIEVQDPGKIATGVRAVYTGGEVFRQASDVGLSTETDFYLREQTAPSANTKTAATATVMADRMLRDNDGEEDSASFSALLPSSKVGLVRAGMRVSCRFEHFDPPYRDWFDWRILRLETTQDEPNPGWYNVKLDVSPVEPTAVVFTGDAFAALLNSQNSPHSPATFGREGDNPGAGWFGEPQIGIYLVPTPLSDRWQYVTVGATMTVRCEAKWIFSATVYAGSSYVTLDIVRIRGGVTTVIGTQTVNDPGGPGLHYWQPAAYVNVTNVDVEAGDLIGVDLPSPLELDGDNLGCNESYLRVGRGTISMNSGWLIWVGP